MGYIPIGPMRTIDRLEEAAIRLGKAITIRDRYAILPNGVSMGAEGTIYINGDFVNLPGAPTYAIEWNAGDGWIPVVVSDNAGWCDGDELQPACRFCGKPFEPNVRGVCSVCGGPPRGWDVKRAID